MPYAAAKEYSQDQSSGLMPEIDRETRSTDIE